MKIGNESEISDGTAPTAPAVGRFAPSPSGRMHLGNVFTALLAWLSVRAANGVMLLRVEDLDPDRSKPEYIAALRDDLRWLGLDWDAEMPLQSTRTEAYRGAFERLSADIYPCYCSRAELHAASAPHASDGETIYSGTCRGLTDARRKEKTRPPAWRIRVPDETVAFTDGVFGPVSQNLARECGDFILRRSDGVYAYQLAVVCDDAFGGVTQVVRGADLLGSTPRQLWLYHKLSLTPPSYCHVPLLVAPDGRRLSKREHDLELSHLRDTFSAEQIIGSLGYLSGILPYAVKISAQELISEFSWEKIGTQPVCVYDFDKFFP